MLDSVSDARELYERDYFTWLQETALALKNQRWEAVDLPNLIEELESMGRSEKNALRSNLVIVLLHLLKWQYQPSKQSDSWLNSIHQLRIELALEDSPSLQPYLEDIFLSCYIKARRLAATETRLEELVFPVVPPYTLAEAVNSSFLPDSLP